MPKNPELDKEVNESDTPKNENLGLFLKTIEESSLDDVTVSLDTTIVCGHLLTPLSIILGDEQEAQKFLNDLDTEVKNILEVTDFEELQNKFGNNRSKPTLISLSTKMQARLARVGMKVALSSNEKDELVKSLFYPRERHTKKQFRNSHLKKDLKTDEDFANALAINEMRSVQKRSEVRKILFEVTTVVSLVVGSIAGLVYGSKIAEDWNDFLMLLIGGIGFFSGVIVGEKTMKELAKFLNVNPKTEGKKIDLLDYFTPTSDIEQEAYDYLETLIDIQAKLKKFNDYVTNIINAIKDRDVHLSDAEILRAQKEALILQTISTQVVEKITNTFHVFDQTDLLPLEVDPKATKRLEKNRSKAIAKAEKEKKKEERKNNSWRARRRRRISQKKQLEQQASNEEEAKRIEAQRIQAREKRILEMKENADGNIGRIAVDLNKQI